MQLEASMTSQDYFFLWNKDSGIIKEASSGVFDVEHLKQELSVLVSLLLPARETQLTFHKCIQVSMSLSTTTTDEFMSVS